MNGNLLRGFDIGCKNIKPLEVIFHNLFEEMRVSRLKMCIEYAPSVHATDQLVLSKQKKIKEKEGIDPF